MATIRQIEANRRNAQRSTGPKTDAGKAAACLNRLKHGLRAETVVLPEESQEKFDALCAQLTDRYLPDGIEEDHLVEQMAVNWWRAARTGRMTSVIFSDARKCETGVRNPNPTPWDVMRHAAFYDRSRQVLLAMSTLEQRYERSYEKARKELERLQKERKKQQQLAEPEPLPEPSEAEESVVEAAPQRKPAQVASEPSGPGAFAPQPAPMAHDVPPEPDAGRQPQEQIPHLYR